MSRKRSSIIALILFLTVVSIAETSNQEMESLTISIRMVPPDEVEKIVEFSLFLQKSSSIIFPISYDISDVRTEAYLNGDPLSSAR